MACINFFGVGVSGGCVVAGWGWVAGGGSDDDCDGWAGVRRVRSFNPSMTSAVADMLICGGEEV